MTRTRTRKSQKARETRQQSTPLTHDDELPDAEGSDSDSDSIQADKDQTELELEKLVFGDEAGFKEGLKSYNLESLIVTEEGTHIASEDGAKEDDLEDFEDADLFFLDSGPGVSSTQDLNLQSNVGEEEDSDRDDPPAWVDSDDERITVSLASNSRLRKLRRTEAEDVVNGKEYTRRLREQYERLYPVPEWVSQEQPDRKRRRISGADDSSESNNFVDEMSVDNDALSAQPLAQLLQNANSITLTSTYKASSTSRLRPELIDIQRTKDVGSTQPSAVTCLSFHPSSPLLLTSGPSSTLSLFHISPSSTHPNPLLTNLHIRSTPIITSVFTPPSGSKIFFSGRRRYFHVWDLQTGEIQKISRVYGHQDEQKSMEKFKLSRCGRWMALGGSSRKGGGVVNILDANTSQWVAQVRVEGKGGTADFEFWSDGEGLLLVSKSGEVVEYSIQEQRVLARWIDEGGNGATVVALGGGNIGRKPRQQQYLGGDRFVAVGSQSGITNIYDRSSWMTGDLPSHPVPTKVLKQLITPTSHLVFSPDGQILAMSSRWKRDALRLMHVPSLTVYKNWPTSTTPLGRITSVAFSPMSKMLAVGNEQGKVRLWEIR